MKTICKLTADDLRTNVKDFYVFHVDTPDDVEEIMNTLQSAYTNEVFFLFDSEEVPIRSDIVITIDESNSKNKIYCNDLYAHMYKSIEDYIYAITRSVRHKYHRCVGIDEEQIISTPFFYVRLIHNYTTTQKRKKERNCVI